MAAQAGLHIRLVIRRPMATIAARSSAIDRRLVRLVACVAVRVSDLLMKAALLPMAGCAVARRRGRTMRRVTAQAVAALRMEIRRELMTRCARLRRRHLTGVRLVAQRALVVSLPGRLLLHLVAGAALHGRTLGEVLRFRVAGPTVVVSDGDWSLLLRVAALAGRRA